MFYSPSTFNNSQFLIYNLWNIKWVKYIKYFLVSLWFLFTFYVRVFGLFWILFILNTPELLKKGLLLLPKLIQKLGSLEIIPVVEKNVLLFFVRIHSQNILEKWIYLILFKNFIALIRVLQYFIALHPKIIIWKLYQ